jgi:glycosyltransferase involved in cell wall biosynthesis
VKVLHVEAGMNLYGGALQVFYLLGGLAKKEGVESVLVCPEGSAIAEAAREKSFTVRTVPIRGDLDLALIPRLTGIIREERPELIHLHGRRGADVLGGIAGRLTGIPCILTRRVDNPESRLLVTAKYRLYQHVITISEGIREVLVSEGVPSDKVTCVRSAVDLTPYSAPCDLSWFLEEFDLQENTLACAVVAQFIERKGHRYLFEAIPSILRAVPESHFLLFGKGPLEDELREICRRMGIENKVTFAGFRADLQRILGCLDLLIHPALMEGLGVSLLQAAAAGSAIVGTRVGGIPEIVRDGVNGYLIPPGDVLSLGEAVIRLLKDRYLCRQMGGKGRKIVEEDFSIEARVKGNLGVYHSLVNPEVEG